MVHVLLLPEGIWFTAHQRRKREWTVFLLSGFFASVVKAEFNNLIFVHCGGGVCAHHEDSPVASTILLLLSFLGPEYFSLSSSDQDYYSQCDHTVEFSVPVGFSVRN